MKDLLRNLAYRLGALGLWHRLRNRRALTVLMFHRVLPDGDPRFALAEREFTLSLSNFRRTLDFVERHYSVVRLQDVERWAQGQGELPQCPVLLTFDDGWRDTLTVAAPELLRRGQSAVLFLASEVPQLSTPRWWQDALVQAWATPAERSRLCSAAGLEDGPAQASHGLWRLTAQLAAWPEPQRIAWLQQHAPGLVPSIEQRQMLTAEELPQLEPAALEVAGHGHTHAPLTLAANSAAELQASHALVKQHRTGVAAMSFPHGAWNPALLAQARQAGFELVFSSEQTLSRRPAVGSVVQPLGRIHLPENAWTCRQGVIDPARLASFLFGRAHASAPPAP